MAERLLDVRTVARRIKLVRWGGLVAAAMLLSARFLVRAALARRTPLPLPQEHQTAGDGTLTAFGLRLYPKLTMAIGIRAPQPVAGH